MSTNEDTETLFRNLYDAVDKGNVSKLKEYLAQDKYTTREVLDFQIKFALKNEFDEVYEDGETILHIAADKTDAEAVAALIEAGANQKSKDNLDRIPLHLVLDGGCRCKKCSIRNEECIKVLLEKDTKVINAEDQNKQTPLYYSANHMMPNCASILLENGADINHKTGKKPDVFLLVQKIPEVMAKELDKGIKFHDKDSSKLLLDFSKILPEDSTRVSMSSKEGASEGGFSEAQDFPRDKEMALLDRMLKAHKEGKELLLTHPLTEAFLFLKWTEVSKWFWIIRILYYGLAILYTSYVFNVFLINCEYPVAEEDEPNNNNSIKDEGDTNRDSVPCEPTVTMIVMSSAMSLGIGFMFLNEFYEMYLDRVGYFRIGINYAWWILCITASITILPGFGMDVQDWMYPIAGFGVFFAWGMTLVQVGRIPQVGVYVEMLGKVLKDFAIFFATYSALLIGFALGFCVLFPQHEMFKKENQPLALVKVLLIMIGESDYEELLLEESNDRLDVIEYSILAHIMFVGFIIIITIVLMNLLLGLAVSDIQELQKTASLVTVTRQIQQISLFESLIYSNLLPRQLSQWAIDKFSIVTIIKKVVRNERQKFHKEKKDGNDTEFEVSNGNAPKEIMDKMLPENPTILFEFFPMDPNDKSLPEHIKAKFIPCLTSSPCLNPHRHKQSKRWNILSNPSSKRGESNVTDNLLAGATSPFKLKPKVADSIKSTELSPEALQQIKQLLEPLQTAIFQMQKKMEEINSV